MAGWSAMTVSEQEAARQERLNEVGTEPPCPFCLVARVRRSDYVRCNRCGINWLDGEDLTRNPKAERWEKFMASVSAQSTRSTGSYPTAASSGVPTVAENTNSPGVVR